MFSLTPHTLTLSPLLCIPVGSDIVVYELFSGKKIKKLRGHYGSVSCCAVSGRELELYSGGSDSNILVWSPPQQVSCGVCMGHTGLTIMLLMCCYDATTISH